MKDEIKEILDDLRTYKDRYEYFLFNNLSFSDRDYKAKILLDYITNLQTIEQQYSAILSENAELENKITNLQEKLEVSQTNEETYRLEMQDITKCLGLKEDTIFDEVKEYATNLQEEVKSANESITWWQDRFNALHKENKRLIEKDKVIIGLNNTIIELHSVICEKQAKINRLNNIINELENYINGRIDVLTVSVDNKSKDQYFNNKCIGGVQELKNVLDKLKD